MKSKYTIDLFDEKDIEKSKSFFPEEENQYITETAGFIPLEVKMKQFEQNGLIAQFQVQDFDSNDYRDMYLNPDFNITPEDDFEDVQEKIEMQRKFISQLKEQKAKSNGNNEPPEAAKAGTEELKKVIETVETAKAE